MCLTDCEASQLGGVLGRVSNGIKGASFVLNGTDYSVTDSTVGWDKVIYYCIHFHLSDHISE